MTRAAYAPVVRNFEPHEVALSIAGTAGILTAFFTLLIVAGKDWATREKRERSMRLFMERVAPELRELTPVRDRETASA